MLRLRQLYSQLRGQQPTGITPLSAAGSNRLYFRLGDDGGQPTLIGVIGTSVEENNAFIHIAGRLAAAGINVPEVVAVSDDRLCYLQTDLGTTSLYDAVAQGRKRGGLYDDAERRLLNDVIAQLPRLQLLGAKGIDFSMCYPQAEMDEDNVLFDLNYFKYCFLKPSHVDFNELRLDRDFHRFANDLLRPSALPKGFVYRDFQVRNIMLDAGRTPWFIDFQGGRRGPLYYDLASFLYQASAHYPEALRTELLNTYTEALRQVLGLTGITLSEPIEAELSDMTAHLMPFVLFRMLQVLGAYGYRGYFERKQYFIDSIPAALGTVRQLVATLDLTSYPEMLAALQRLTTPPALRVRVRSFSYKKGIPADESGNGGGYVFDCRSTNNPGRYPQYRNLTGLDQPVIDFLEDDGEILHFLDSVYALADFHVERYLQRGFTDLMFSFGCTGGQHRSVYCAQHLAEHLHAKYGVSVHLVHREQGITQEL